MGLLTEIRMSSEAANATSVQTFEIRVSRKKNNLEVNCVTLRLETTAIDNPL